MREMYGVAEEVGQGGGSGGEVHLDQLPAYEEVGDSLPVPVAAPVSVPTNGGTVVGGSEATPSFTSADALRRVDGETASPTRRPQGQPQQHASVPDEPPPGYDEIGVTTAPR